MGRPKKRMARIPPHLNDDAPKREAILRSAMELFAQRGFHGTTVPAIAAHARVGAGTVYRYFADKEEIVNVLYRHWKHKLGDFLIPQDADDATIREIFHSLWHRLFVFRNAHPVALAFLELHHHGSYLNAQARSAEVEVLMPLVLFARRGQLQGKLKKMTPETLISLVYGAFVGLIRAAERDFLQLTPQVIDAAENAMWDAIKA